MLASSVGASGAIGAVVSSVLAPGSSVGTSGAVVSTVLAPGSSVGASGATGTIVSTVLAALIFRSKNTLSGCEEQRISS